MTTFNKFEDIEAWQKARELTREIYSISRETPFCKDFRLCDQIRDASVSIMSNIAEGFERNGNAEFIQFLSIAKGSTGEIRAQLYAVIDQGYIKRETFDYIFSLALEVNNKIGGLMQYLRAAKMRGTKYKH